MSLENKAAGSGGAWSVVWMSGIWGATEGQHLMGV